MMQQSIAGARGYCFDPSGWYTCCRCRYM